MNFIILPSSLEGFCNTDTKIGKTVSDRDVFVLDGVLKEPEPSVCPHCGGKHHIHGSTDASLHHLPFGPSLSLIRFEKKRYHCPRCKSTSMQEVPFQSEEHRITKPLETYCEDLLYRGLTNKMVAELTGLGKNTVKEIDKKRLQRLYYKPGTTESKVPEETPRVIGIDEFKLHDGHQYATVIISMETGHVLWLQGGKKKQVVYDFIESVGDEWMENVEAVCCDMNSDFQEAFEESFDHIQVVFDHFHIVKNFNDKVVSAVRKEEQARLKAEGKTAEADSLKRSKYILTSSVSTLQKKDEEDNKKRYERYQKIIKDNELLLTADIVKEKLSYAYTLKDEVRMADEIAEIIDICRATGNKHFKWFSNLLENHFEGIVAHAYYQVTSGKVEGVNNMIKTVRRQAYGYPDDDYFFLKIYDASRRTYIRNPKSHKICD